MKMLLKPVAWGASLVLVATAISIVLPPEVTDSQVTAVGPLFSDTVIKVEIGGQTEAGWVLVLRGIVTRLRVCSPTTISRDHFRVLSESGGELALEPTGAIYKTEREAFLDKVGDQAIFEIQSILDLAPGAYVTRITAECEGSVWSVSSDLWYIPGGEDEDE